MKSLLKRSNPRRQWLMIVVVTSAFLGLIMLNTNPNQAGPFIITVFFLVLFSCLYAFGQFIRHLFITEPQPRSALVVGVSTFIGGGMVALNTISLGVGEVVLLVILAVLGAFYWSRLRQ
jgi:predicted lysophospholipase L1 biosynthesis ABC-type transport system permease subunit